MPVSPQSPGVAKTRTEKGPCSSACRVRALPRGLAGAVSWRPARADTGPCCKPYRCLCQGSAGAGLIAMQPAPHPSQLSRTSWFSCSLRLILKYLATGKAGFSVNMLSVLNDSLFKHNTYKGVRLGRSDPQTRRGRIELCEPSK